MTLLFSLPILAALLLWLAGPSASASRRASLLLGTGLGGLAAWLLGRVAQGEVLRHAFGGWQPPLGIGFAADRLSALFVALHAVLLLVTLATLRPELHGSLSVRRAHPLLFLLSAALFGAFLTADLFNLFVMFELVLVCSYLLLQVPGTRRSRTALLPTIVVNLLASSLFLAGLGLLYGMTGSLAMDGLAARMAEAPPTLRRSALAMLATAFATKAALVPVCFWMPATYPTLAAPLAALFAGIMTKLGVYALLRIQPLLALDPALLDALVWAGALSAILGVLAALSQLELRRLLAFHSVSQVGYMVLGLGLGTPLGLAAALFFALHHSLVKSTLYLVADPLERASGSRDLRRMAERRPASAALALCFGVAAFSLVGVPPLSGFFGKLGVLRAALEDGAFAGLALLVVASLFTLTSMLKIWRYAFQRRPGEPEAPDSGAAWGAAPLGAMVMLVLALALGAGPVQEYAEATAEQLMGGDHGSPDAAPLADASPGPPGVGVGR